jgi:ankyrin repeat protein
LNVSTAITLLPITSGRRICMSDSIKAAANGDLATFRRLHAVGVDVTECSDYGTTAIMRAARQGHIAMVKFLQAAGASSTEKSDYGYSAPHLAAVYGKLSVVQYFSKRSERASLKRPPRVKLYGIFSRFSTPIL